MTATADLHADIGEVGHRGGHPGPGPRARRADQRGLSGPEPDPRERAQGLAPVHGRPHARHRRPGPDRSHGGVVLRWHLDRVVRPRPHPQGPVGEHRRRGRPAGRGHHRHRADAELPDPLPPGQEPSLARSAPCSTSLPGGSSDPGRLHWFTIEDRFVVGHGLDRRAVLEPRFVGVLRPEVYSGG